MATVLVTGVGGTAGTATVRSLINRTAHEVVGVDMDTDATGFFFLDEHRTVPAAHSEEWVSAMEGVITDCEIDVVVPIVDEELSKIPELEERVADDVGFVLPRHDVVTNTLDKYQMYEYLSERDCKTPRTILASEQSEFSLEYPLIAKPRFGHGSRGVELIKSSVELDNYLTFADRDPTEFILQEHIEGTEFTTSVVATQQNELLSIVPKEVIEKKMNTIRGVTRDNRSVRHSCQEIFNVLRPCGPINVQQIVDERGTPYTIEINPRFSSTACLTVAAGVNELDLLIRDATGESVSNPGKFTSDLHLIRYTDQLYKKEGEVNTMLGE